MFLDILLWIMIALWLSMTLFPIGLLIYAWLWTKNSNKRDWP